MINGDRMDDYPLVGVDPDVRIPQRSVLASLRPMGLGTAYRQSLSSYYLELAHLHHLSPITLAREIIVPRIKVGKAHLNDDNFILWKLPLFNGIGTVPETWAEHLSALTGQKDLIDLTLVPLRPYTNSQHLMSIKKKWCPLCFSEAAKEGRVYGQLLWELNVVEACPKHGIKLVSHCRCNGKSPLSPLNVKHLSGFCDSCGDSLSQNTEESIENAPEKDVKRAQIVAALLDEMKRPKPDIDRATVEISTFLKSAVDNVAKGNAALFGRLLGIHKNTLHYWMHGKCIPPLPQMVEIALLCGCSISDIVRGAEPIFREPELISVHSGPQMLSRTKKPEKRDRELVKLQLQALANENPPISIAAAAVRIGVHPRTLFRHFGNITRQMIHRRRAYNHSEKKRKFAERCDIFRQSAIRLLQQGIRPTRRLVRLDIRGRGVGTVSKGDEQSSCSRICREVMESAAAGCRLIEPISGEETI